MERTLVIATLPHLLRAVHAALVEHRDEVDALNVFPVPDGDTGTNLAATAGAVVEALPGDGVPAPRDIVRAALRSARGNSGVIFSQVVRGVVEAVADLAPDGHGDVEALAEALERADVLARGAVANPVEGTILTAVTTAATAAREQFDAGNTDLDAVLVEVTARVASAVRATRDQLEVLRDAGVVDAGARGFEVALTAVHSLVAGRPLLPAPLDQVVPNCSGQGLPLARLEQFPLEVQFLLDGDAAVAATLRGRLAELGDSVVVVEADGLVSAHVHTSDVDAVLAAAAAHGEAREVRTTDLRQPDDGDGPTATLAVVAVVPAGGLADLAHGCGAAVVEGAAGRLPSVDDLLRAIRSCPDGPVTVLPGHPNVVPTARQAALLAAEDDAREVQVVEGAVHPLVVLSCLALEVADPEQLGSNARRCRAGEVVGAVRDAMTPVGEVRAGQPIVVVDGDVVAIADDLSQGLEKLLVELDAAGAELVTVAVGMDADMGVGDVMGAIADLAGEAELEVIDGGQRPSLLLALAER